jgi:DNA-binding MarR family transcriptional regulator
VPKSSHKTAPDDNRLFRLLNEISIIDQLVMARFNSALPYKLTTAQFGVLNHFVRLGGVRSPAALADAFQVTRATMTSTLQKLEAKGFIDISPDPSDGRAKRVSLTETGRAAREEALRDADPMIRDLAEVITPDEIATLLPLLEKLRIWLDNNR